MKVDLRQVNTYSNQVFKQRVLEGYLPPKSKGSLSFKGMTSFLNKKVVLKAEKGITEVLGGQFEKMLGEFEELTSKTKINQSITRCKSDMLAFSQRGFLGKAVDNFSYFFKGIWLDIINAFLGKIGKNKKIAESEIFNKLYDSKILKNQRNANRANDLFYTILGLTNKHNEFLQEAAKSSRNIDDIYKEFINKKLNKPVGAFSARNERALNRLVTGTVSAFFVGRDFYNLTMYQTNNEQEAKKSQRKRFKQEMTRIGTSAFMNFSVLGIFSSITNNSMFAAAALTAGASLFAEIASRVKNGVSLIPLTPKKAKEIHDRKAMSNQDKKTKISYKGQEKEQENKLTENNAIQAHKSNLIDINAFIAKTSNKPQSAIANSVTENVAKDKKVESENNQKEGKKNSVLVKLAKVLGVAVAIAFGWDVLIKRGIRPVKAIMEKSDSKLLRFLANIKDNVMLKDRKISKDVMDGILKGIKEHGSESMAKSFAENIGSIDANGYYRIGKVQRKLAIPLKIPEKAMDAIKLPYELICKLIGHTPSWLEKKGATEAGEIRKAIGTLYDEISRKKIPENKISEEVGKRLASIFNNETLMQYDQAKLALFNRTLVTTIASYFFINDFRNQVLIDSAGKDTKRADEVTNERLGHKLTNFVTNAFWMNFFNTTFSKTVMGSLMGAASIAAITELSNESTVRYSIGVPIKKMGSKEEIQEFEAKNYYSNGLYGKWIRFFSKLTGKKPISQKAKKQ